MLKYALAGAAIAAVLAAGYASVGWAAPAGAASSAGPTDTEPPPETTPAPDPAPPAPKPAPKPAAKPTPKPAPKLAHVYHAPVQSSEPTTPAPQPTYTPPPVQHVTKKVVHHARAHKRPQPAPKVHAQVKDASVVKINGVPTAAVTTNASDALRRSLVIAGIGIAALLFLLVLAVPATAVRFTPPGRVLMDHQTDLVLVGVAILLLTALLFAVTGNG